MDLFTQRCKACNTIYKVRGSCPTCMQARLVNKPVLSEAMGFTMRKALYDNGDSKPLAAKPVFSSQRL